VAQAAAYRQCTPDQRGALTRRILLVALLVPALAPALGGLLVQWLSWRGVLWASLPLAVVAIGLVLAWMPADGARSAPRLQAYALSTAMLALGALLLALTWLGEPGHRAAGAVLLLIAMLLAAVHLRHARQQAQPCCAGRCCPIGACAWRCWSIWQCPVCSSAASWSVPCSCTRPVTARHASAR
jgi:MFS family permease